MAPKGPIQDLMDAAYCGDVAGVEAYLDRYPEDLDALDDPATGQTAAHYAAQADRADVIAFLMQRGANFLIVDPTLGRTPLHDALANGALDVVAKLQELPASVRDALVAKKSGFDDGEKTPWDLAGVNHKHLFVPKPMNPAPAKRVGDPLFIPPKSRRSPTRSASASNLRSPCRGTPSDVLPVSARLVGGVH